MSSLSIITQKNRIAVQGDYKLLNKYNLFEKFRTFPKRFWDRDTKRWLFARNDLEQLTDLFKSCNIDVIISDESDTNKPIELKVVIDTIYIKQHEYNNDLYHKFKSIRGYKWDRINKLHTIPEQAKYEMIKMLNDINCKYVWIDTSVVNDTIEFKKRKVEYTEECDGDDEREASCINIEKLCSPIEKQSPPKLSQIQFKKKGKLTTTPTAIPLDSVDAYKNKSIITKKKSKFARKLSFSQNA